MSAIMLPALLRLSIMSMLVSSAASRIPRPGRYEGHALPPCFALMISDSTSFLASGDSIASSLPADSLTARALSPTRCRRHFSPVATDSWVVASSSSYSLTLLLTMSSAQFASFPLERLFCQRILTGTLPSSTSLPLQISPRRAPLTLSSKITPRLTT